VTRVGTFSPFGSGSPDGLFSNQKFQFGRALDWKMFKYCMAIWNILRIFEIFYDHLVHFVFIWYIFPVWVSCNKKNLATLLRVIDAFGHFFNDKR
jgi:hypothetical protein